MTGVYTPTLAIGTAPKNSGIAIPNITDGFSGSAPDRGAIIEGRSVPLYGDRENDAVPADPTPTPTPTPAPTPVPTPTPLALLPNWVNTLAPMQWYEIPNSAMSTLVTPANLYGNSGPSSKVVAWTSFILDPRSSNVYSVANGGHHDYPGNEVDRLELESNPVRWVRRLDSTPANLVIEDASHYADGRPTSRHSYYGMTFNESDDRIMLVGAIGAYGVGGSFPSIDSYNIGGNNYSPAGTHPNLPPGLTNGYVFTTTANPLTGDIYVFGSWNSSRWTRATNSWLTIGNPGHDLWASGSMSAMDTTRGRILILGGSNSERHLYTLASNTFSQITLSGVDASKMNTSGGALFYVEALDKFIVRLSAAGGAVYQIDPVTFEVTSLTTTNGTTVPVTQNGPYNKFLYVPRLHGAVYIPTHSGNAWFLRLH